MYVFYNPHPQQKIVGDCVKRAITKASGKTYQEVSNELNRVKRAQGARAYNSNSVWREYIEKHLYGKKMSFPAEKGKPRMNGARFCKAYPKGAYILNMAGHLSCCYDGVLYDTWDCSEKCVYTAYEINTLVPMQGIEKLGDLYDECVVQRASSKGTAKNITGEDIINEVASLLKIENIKVTKDDELWIPMTAFQYAHMVDYLTKEKKYKHLVWEQQRGAKKIKVTDPRTGMTLVLKNGSNHYIWCTNNGKG